MKNYLLSLVSLCVIFSFLKQNNLSAQGFNSITTSDGINVIAVGNSGKYYRSGNGGVTYSGYTVAGTPNLNSVTSLDNDVWMAGQNGNVIKTLKTPSPSNTYNVGSNVTLNSITFINSSVGFACGDLGTVYKTVNGGVKWNVSNSGITGVNLNSISFKDENNGTVAGSSGYIYITTNGGSDWTLQSSGTIRNLLKIKYFNDGIVAVGEYGTLLLYSGSGWTNIITRTASDINGVAGINMNNIHVSGGGGFIRNNKNANLKFLNFEINPMLANLVDIFFYDSNKGWAVSSLNKVIIYTNNGGDTWSMPSGSAVSFVWNSKTPAGSGIGNNLCMHPNDRNSMFVVYGKTVYVSRDKGDTWAATATISIGTRAHSFYVSPVDTNIWMAAMENTIDCIVRSTDHGATWTNIISAEFSTYGQPLEMDQNNPSTFYFAPSNDGSTRGLYKSTNDGASFSLISLYGQANINQPCDVIVMWDSSNVIYLGDDGADIWKSTNTGLTWTLVKPNSSSEIPSMCNTVFDKSVCYATTWGSSQVFRTINHGDNWNIVSNNSGSGWGSDLCREDPTVVLTGNYGPQAYLTTNSGANFFHVDSLLGGAGAGIMVPERGVMLNMQTSNLFKLKITYTDVTVMDVIDVQAVSVGTTGVGYFSTPTIDPTGTVKNNNGVAAASFSVTRKITPGNYISTKTVTSLAPNTTATVTYDSWNFNAGTTYTIKDSVYILDDSNPANDAISGNLTPYLGEQATRINQDFTGTFPPAGWSFLFTGTNFWQYNSVSSFGVGVGSAKYNFWSAAAGTVQSMLTPYFSPTIAGDSLEYDHAYAPYSGSTDSLIIETSTNDGANYSALVRLYGKTGATGPFALNTAIGGGPFTPASGQWLKKKWGLPVGTNKIKFRAVSGFGDNLYLDNIKIQSGSIFTQFNIKLAPEGMYNGSTLNLRDSVKAYLRNIASPFAIADSSNAVIDSVTFNAPFVFKNVNTGTYYIQIIHRNAIETWSDFGGEQLTRGTTADYDFTSSQSQAYGNNMILIDTKYCLYSGDIDGDGAITLSDLITVSNDAVSFATGYRRSDLNGDNGVTLTDILLVYNNSSKFIAKNTPVTSSALMSDWKERSKQELKLYRSNNFQNEIKYTK